MSSAYDTAREIVDRFDAYPGMLDAEFYEDDGLVSDPYLTDAGKDWLIAEIEKALKQAGMK